MVAIPCYSAKVHIQTMRCLMADVIKLLSRGDQFAITEDIGNSDIAGSRGAILATFYRSEFDVLVFVDDDVFWTPGELVKLIDFPVDLVGGVYPKKFDDLQWPIRAVSPDGFQFDPNTGLIEVAGIPGGFMKITRNCAEKMIEAYPRQTKRGAVESSQFWPVFDPYELPDEDRLSEDFSFCQRWRDIGGQVWANTEIEMGHIGYKSFTGHLGNYLRGVENNVK